MHRTDVTEHIALNVIHGTWSRELGEWKWLKHDVYAGTEQDVLYIQQK